jgi:hypothetical protein
VVAVAIGLALVVGGGAIGGAYVSGHRSGGTTTSAAGAATGSATTTQAQSRGPEHVAADVPALPPTTKSATAASTAPPPKATSPGFPTDPVSGAAKVEETGSLGLTVDPHRLGRVMGRLTELATANGGYVTSSSLGRLGTLPTGPGTGSIALDVPQGSFDDVLATAKRLGTVTAMSTKAVDVTGQYVDLQAEITALEASRQQYLTIMTKATSIPDILSVQSQLDSIQTQMQQLQGQLQLLDSQTAYSTLDVSVTERLAPGAPRPAAKSGLSKAIQKSVHGFVGDLEDVVRVAGPTLFVLIVGVALLLLVKLGWRQYRRRTL